jgi:hypothetical protein
MKSVVILFFVVVTTQVVRAQSRSASNVVQRGGAPNLTSLLVGLVPAEPIELTGAVDSNSPAIWDLVAGQRKMVVLTSTRMSTRTGGRPSIETSISSIRHAVKPCGRRELRSGRHLRLDERWSRESVDIVRSREDHGWRPVVSAGDRDRGRCRHRQTRGRRGALFHERSFDLGHSLQTPSSSLP